MTFAVLFYCDAATAVSAPGGLRLGGGAGALGRRLQHESLAHQRESRLRQLGLQKLIVGAGEQLSLCARDGRHQVMHGDGLSVQRAVHVGIGGKPHRHNRARLLGNYCPQIAAVLLDGQRQQRLQRAGIEVGEKHRTGMLGQWRCGAAAVGRDVQEQLAGIRVWRPPSPPSHSRLRSATRGAGGWRA